MNGSVHVWCMGGARVVHGCKVVVVTWARGGGLDGDDCKVGMTNVHSLQFTSHLHHIRVCVDFIFQLNLLPPYSLCSQGDNKTDFHH